MVGLLREGGACLAPNLIRLGFKVAWVNVGYLRALAPAREKRLQLLHPRA
jgi:hypothetical protein